MKIAVLGASGNVGSRTVNAALAAGHHVVAFVRSAESVPSRRRLTVMEGDATDERALVAATAGADAVIVTINGHMKDSTFMRRTMPKIIDSVEKAEAGRVVLVSALGAGDSATKTSGIGRLLYRTALGRFFTDKGEADRMLIRSGLDHTIVYPVNLVDAPAVDETAVLRLDEIDTVPGLPTLPFDNVATALVDIAENAEFSGERIVITTPTGWRPAKPQPVGGLRARRTAS